LEKITRLSATTPSTTTLFLYTRWRRRLTIDPCGKRKQIVAATHTHYLSILSNTRTFVFRWRTNYIVKKTLRLFFFLNAIISISLNAPPKLDPVRVFKCGCMTCNTNEKKHIHTYYIHYNGFVFFFFLVQLYKTFE